MLAGTTAARPSALLSCSGGSAACCASFCAAARAPLRVRLRGCGGCPSAGGASSLSPEAVRLRTVVRRG
eukprot:3147768-Prymnesium_polylepis.1